MVPLAHMLHILVYIARVKWSALQDWHVVKLTIYICTCGQPIIIIIQTHVKEATLIQCHHVNVHICLQCNQ